MEMLNAKADAVLVAAIVGFVVAEVGPASGGRHLHTKPIAPQITVDASETTSK